MKNRLIIFLISLIIIITVLILFEFNTKYNIKSEFVIEKNNNNKGNLIIVTHNYEHKDIFIILNYFGNRKEKYYILFADKIWNTLLEPFRTFNIEFIYVTSGTVDKIINRLAAGDNVIMFLYKESDSSGLYHILNYFNNELEVTLAKIEDNQNKQNTQKNYQDYQKHNKNQISNHYNSSFYNIFVNNFNKTFDLKFEKYNYSESNYLKSNTFMINFKNQLYS